MNPRNVVMPYPESEDALVETINNWKFDEDDVTKNNWLIFLFPSSNPASDKQKRVLMQQAFQRLSLKKQEDVVYALTYLWQIKRKHFDTSLETQDYEAEVHRLLKLLNAHMQRKVRTMLSAQPESTQ